MTALERNLDIRSQEAAPVLEAFSIFDPSCLPKPEDPAFKKYAVDEVKMLCKQFQFDKDHTCTVVQLQVPDVIMEGTLCCSPGER